jgi:hypothetical protein
MVSVFAVLAVIGFVGSVLVAAGLLSAIPYSAQDMTEGEKVLDRGIFLFHRISGLRQNCYLASLQWVYCPSAPSHRARVKSLSSHN